MRQIECKKRLSFNNCNIEAGNLKILNLSLPALVDLIKSSAQRLFVPGKQHALGEEN